MTPDDIRQAWNTQSSGIRVKIDAESLDAETRRYQKQFTTRLFWRDLREVGVALLLIPVWLFLGLKHALPWTWYLSIPALMWVAGYMLVDRRRNRPRPEEPGESLCRRIESTMAQIEGQNRILRNVHIWGLTPLVVAILAFVGQVALRDGATDLFSVIVMWGAVPLFFGISFFIVYRLNQHAVRTDLIPRRDELKKQLQDLQDESAETSP